MPKRKHKSGAAKRSEKKRLDKLLASQKGALNRYFPTTSRSSADVHDDNQRQESESEQDDDHSLSADHDVNEPSLDGNIDDVNDEGAGEDILQPSPEEYCRWSHLEFYFI